MSIDWDLNAELLQRRQLIGRLVTFTLVNRLSEEIGSMGGPVVVKGDVGIIVDAQAGKSRFTMHSERRIWLRVQVGEITGWLDTEVDDWQLLPEV